MPHRCTLRKITHQAGAIFDLSNYKLFRIIPDPGSQRRVTLSFEFISAIPVQAGARHVTIPEWGEQCSNCGMPGLMSISDTIWRTVD